MKIVCRNRKAGYNYSFCKDYETGIVLIGDEVKSIKQGNISIKEGYILFLKGELFLINCHVANYKFGQKKIDTYRNRKLLVHKRELNRIFSYVHEKKLSLIPLQVYINSRGLIKLKIALGRGNKLYDKRRILKEKEWKKNKSEIKRIFR